MTPPPPQIRGRLPRVLRLAGSVLGSVVVFAGAAAVGVVLHLNRAVARRFVASTTNELLRPVFKGRIHIDSLDRLGLDGADGIRGRIVDPEGVEVIIAQGVSARISLVALGRSLLGRGDLEIELDDVVVDYADVNLHMLPGDVPRIAHAFETASSASSSGAKGRQVRLWVPSVVVKHAWVHGHIAGAPPLDGDVDAVRASLLVRPPAVAIECAHLAVRTRGAPKGLDLLGDARGHVTLPARSGRDLDLDGTFVGTLGGTEAKATASTDLTHLDATADLPHVTPENLRVLIPDTPTFEPLAGHFEAHGDLPNLDAAAHVTLGQATVEGTGHVTLGAETRITAKVDARAVNLRAFLPALPASSLGATTNVSLVVPPDGTLRGDFTIDAAPGNVEANVVPRIAAKGKIVESAAGFTVRGQAAIAEAGAPTDVTFDLHPEGRSYAADVRAHSSIARLDGIARVGPIAQGSAEVEAQGRIRFADASLDATAHAEIASFVHGSQRIARAHVDVVAQGRLAALSLDTTLTAEGLQAGSMKFARARVTATGPITAPRVEASLEGAGKDDVTITARADVVRFANHEVVVEGAVVAGIGEPVHLTLRAAPGTLAVLGESKGVDLGRLSHLLGTEAKIRAGRLGFDVDLLVEGGSASGRISADLSHADFSEVNDGNAHVDAIVSGRRASFNVHASLGTIGYADVKSSNIEIGGTGPLRLDSWRRAWGRVDLDARVDLAKLAPLFPRASEPFAEIGGALVIRASSARDSIADPTPEFTIAARTEGLLLAKRGATTGDAADATESFAWRLEGVDLELDAKIDRNTGDADLSTRVVDREGALLALDAKSSAIPYADLASGDLSLARFRAIPFTALLVLPNRRLDKLPPILQMQGSEGDVEATLRVEGTMSEPKVELTGRARGIKTIDSPVEGTLTAALQATYDGREGDIGIKVRTPKTEVLDGTAHLRAAIADVLAHASGQPIPWDASARVRLNEFRLGTVAALADRQVRGRLSGEVVVTDYHKDARASVELRTENLQVGSAKYTSGIVRVAIDDRFLNGSLRVEQSDGFVQGSTKIGVTWGAALSPSIDDTQRLVASLEAKSFRAAGLLPFVESVFSELDGRIDGAARIELDPGQTPKVGGAIALRDGLVQIAAMGEEFHDARAKLVLSPDGTMRLDDLVAYGLSGKITGSGTGHMRGLKFVDAQATVSIPKNQPVPVGVQGMQIGDVYGTFKLKADASADQKIWNLDVAVPLMHVELPASSSHAVQDLGDAENARVGVYRGAARHFVVLPIDGEDIDEQKAIASTVTLNVTAHLGEDVEIRRGPNLKIALDGNPTVKVTDKARVSGQVRLKSGSLQVQGKRFDIEKGTVTFVGADASNPLVVVTAGWTAPDGTRVYADFVGPLKTGEVRLRSEPSRPKNEILALILFGTADGSSSTPYATPQGDNATKVGGAAGSLATEGLSRGLDELTGLEITTKIDTTNSASPRPEVELQIARDISIQIAFVLGTPPPGTNPDTTFATIDWRFYRNWSLETTFGDQGSSVADVIWQYRY